MLVLIVLVDMAQADPLEDAAVLATKAHDAFLAWDQKTAVRSANEALALDPDNVKALATRGMAFITMAGLPENQIEVAAAYRAMLLAMGRADLQRVIALAPDSTWAATAMVHLEPDTIWMPETPCPADAVTEFHGGEVLFGAGDMPAARAKYKKAAKLCPANTTYVTYIGDTYWREGDPTKALKQFEKALSVDSCDVLAHAYAADALITLRRLPEARVHIVDGVTCNPTYQPNWAMLGEFQREAHKPIAARSGSRPRTVQGAPADATPDQRAWASWSSVHYASPAPGTAPLDVDVAAVRAGLTAYGPVPADSMELWPVLSRADAGGMLDAAVYVLMLDKDLIPGFEVWRREHHAEAVVFVDTLVAPK